MVRTVEFLMQPPTGGRYGDPMLRALIVCAQKDNTSRVNVTTEYEGRSQVLVLWGVGAPQHDMARNEQKNRGGVTLCWDVGYFGKHRPDPYMRVSINHEHPQAELDTTPNDPSRFAAHGIKLRNTYDSGGHIILAALGRKSRSYLRKYSWESDMLRQLRQRFPGRKIIYRPKPTKSQMVGSYVKLDCPTDHTTPIEDLLRGAALIVSHHSNVSIDATIANVPFEVIDGAAMWLQAKPYTVDNRLDFLYRLCWWQWQVEEAKAAWRFLTQYVDARYLARREAA